MGEMGCRKYFRLCAAVLVVFAAGGGAAVAASPENPHTGLFVTNFDQVTPWAAASEILQRTQPVVYAEREAQHDLPSGQVITPAKETWQVYVPKSYDGTAPYGVLVWIQPEDESRFPPGWGGVLDARHVIYVSAANSGNDQGVYSRRIPLALTGLANIESRYRIDPARVYAGGFSGGGKVASTIAAAYADVFTGGLFVANSFGIGTMEIPVPAPEVYKLMRERGRYVFLVGSDDPVAELVTNRAVAADEQHCILRVKLVNMFNRGHVNASAAYLNYAINYLDSPPPLDTGKLAACERQLHIATAN